MSYPRIIAHRCGGALAPENTLTGLRIASRLGARGVEFDVMLSADGVPVLMHDETLERTTTGSGRVADSAAASLAALDAGVGHHRAFAVSPVPTFSQALQLCRQIGLWANVELKPSAGTDAATARAVAAVLHDESADVGRIVLSSFSAAALQVAATAAPAYPRALLVDTVPDDWRQCMAAVDAVALHVSSRALELTAGPLQAACNAGVTVACYTVNDRSLAERLFSAGLGAIFTDRPDLWNEREM